ncbi:MAG: internal scaffolding protein [Microvirus sp.]|nr:MAG: internal scaffolding protein [Microvirus sp.]
MKDPFFKTPFNHDTLADAQAGGLICKDKSKTQQSQADDADINTIVRRFGLTGELPAMPMPPTYQDFADVFDYQSAQNTIAEANASFYLLPAAVRSRFNNDTGLWLNAIDKAVEEGNLGRLAEMGIALPETAPEPLAKPTPQPPTGGATEGATAPSKSAT